MSWRADTAWHISNNAHFLSFQPRRMRRYGCPAYYMLEPKTLAVQHHYTWKQSLLAFEDFFSHKCHEKWACPRGNVWLPDGTCTQIWGPLLQAWPSASTPFNSILGNAAQKHDGKRSKIALLFLCYVFHYALKIPIRFSLSPTSFDALKVHRVKIHSRMSKAKVQ